MTQARIRLTKGEDHPEHVEDLGAKLAAIGITESPFLTDFIPRLLKKEISLTEAITRIESALTHFEIFPPERP